MLHGVGALRGRRDGEGLDPHVWLDPVRYAAVAREIAAALGDARRRGCLVARLRALDASTGGASPAVRDASSSRAMRLRLSRGPLRARAGAAGRSPAGGRAGPGGASSGWSTTCARRARRRSSPRRSRSPALADTVAREAGARPPARPARGPHARRRSTRAPTTSPSCARTSPRCGRRSDAGSRRPSRRSSSTASRSPTAAVRPCSRTSRSGRARRFLGIAGPNGGGKTTLLRLALGLERPTSGSVRLFGSPPGTRGSPADRLRLPARASRRRGRPSRSARSSRPAGSPCAALSGRCARTTTRRRASRSSASGSHARADAPLRTLSGGMQQRAFIARALAAEPALLALDEPTTGVDAESQESLAALLAELAPSSA